MKIWQIWFLGASVLAPGALTGNIYLVPHPNPAFQIGQDDRMIPTNRS
jgi:hypothetical protein